MLAPNNNFAIKPPLSANATELPSVRDKNLISVPRCGGEAFQEASVGFGSEINAISLSYYKLWGFNIEFNTRI